MRHLLGQRKGDTITTIHKLDPDAIPYYEMDEGELLDLVACGDEGAARQLIIMEEPNEDHIGYTFIGKGDY